MQVYRILIWLVAAAGSLPAFAAPNQADCSGNGPLISEDISISESLQFPVVLGEWKLPVSSLRPDVITEARVRLTLTKGQDGQSSTVQLSFTFPDPKTMGLPFSFERAEFTWMSGGISHSAEMDWSQQCAGPGRSLYPKQAWAASIDLGSDLTILPIEKPSFRLWGSRN